MRSTSCIQFSSCRSCMIQKCILLRSALMKAFNGLHTMITSRQLHARQAKQAQPGMYGNNDLSPTKLVLCWPEPEVLLCRHGPWLCLHTGQAKQFGSRPPVHCMRNLYQSTSLAVLMTCLAHLMGRHMKDLQVADAGYSIPTLPD